MSEPEANLSSPSQPEPAAPQQAAPRVSVKDLGKDVPENLRRRIVALMKLYVERHDALPRRLHVDKLSEVDFYAMSPAELGEKLLGKISKSGVRDALDKGYLGLAITWDAEDLAVS